ncbi:tail tape measure protein [Sandarakinorhabdus sp. DWP1-3-1]|uniref:tail tape measure protein n=1 Tax=Sandarakinorhabdus sp. DWP1-3-1 TaxID=2804627 RepID=UPI003CEDC86A
MIGDETNLDTLVIGVRADTSGFLAGVAEMRRELDGPLAQGAERAGGSIERALARAAITGKFGFEDLRRVALNALADIATSALRSDIGALFGGGSGGSGLFGAIGAGIGSLFGAPGRAIGGPVSGGRPYLVGERGPELFVPAGAGRVETGVPGRGAVNVTVNVAAPREASPALMRQTGAQVARAVRQAMARVDA